MSVYIDREATVADVYVHRSEESPTDTDTEGERNRARSSDGDMSDAIPLQDRTNSRKRGRRKLDFSESESDKENRSHSSKRKQKRPVHRDNSKAALLSELQETNKLMKKLTSKMNRHEARLQAIEDQLKEAASSSSSTPKRSTKRAVPCEVKRETRRVYNLLLEDQESNFEGWKIEPGVTFKDPHNQAVVNVLIQEVMGLNPSFLTQHIRDAAYRFYCSRKEDASARRRGTFDNKTKCKRRHERLARKLQERKKIFEVGTYRGGDKEKWLPLLTMDFMSSDESGTDEGIDVLVTRPLKWESSTVSDFKRSLDVASLEQKSPLAKRQMKPRKKGLDSARPKPLGGNYPAWAFDN